MNFRRPMLAASLLPSNIDHTNENILAAMQKLRYPVLATIKKDGIRALRMNGSLLSRTLKVIPNKSIVARSLVLPGGFDMELWNPVLDYNTVESIVMSREHERSDEIQFHVLDWVYRVNPEFGYSQRIALARERCLELDRPDVNLTAPALCENSTQLMNLFLQYEFLSYEGICFRTLYSPYKQGRSTLKEQYLVKLARFIRTELTIIGFEEQMENTNPEKRNALGYMKRTSDDVYMVGKNTLGAFVCMTQDDYVLYKSSSYATVPETVSVGTGVGLTDKLRKTIWDNRDKYIGQTIVVKHKPIGQKDKLRHPIFVGFRKDIDI